MSARRVVSSRGRIKDDYKKYLRLARVIVILSNYLRRKKQTLRTTTVKKKRHYCYGYMHSIFRNPLFLITFLSIVANLTQHNNFAPESI